MSEERRMIRIFALTLLASLAGCVSADQYSANINCARQAGCVSSFANTGYGPVHAQAVAPDAPSGLQPQK
jgi:outer membrane lipoprotein SlyB